MIRDTLPPQATASPAATARRPGGRTARNTQAIFNAVIAELASRRFDDVSIETVALRAGVHRSTIYRRWATKPRLLVDALENAAAARLDMPDTGSLEGDLDAIAHAIARMLVSREGAAVLTAYTVEAPHNAELRAAFVRFRAVRERVVKELVEKAIERKEVPPGTDPARVLTNLLGPMYYEVLIEVRPPTGVLIADAVATTVSAARLGVFASAPPEVS